MNRPKSPLVPLIGLIPSLPIILTGLLFIFEYTSSKGILRELSLYAGILLLVLGVISGILLCRCARKAYQDETSPQFAVVIIIHIIALLLNIFFAGSTQSPLLWGCVLCEIISLFFVIKTIENFISTNPRLMAMIALIPVAFPLICGIVGIVFVLLNIIMGNSLTSLNINSFEIPLIIIAVLALAPSIPLAICIKDLYKTPVKLHKKMVKYSIILYAIFFLLLIIIPLISHPILASITVPIYIIDIAGIIPLLFVIRFALYKYLDELKVVRSDKLSNQIKDIKTALKDK